MRIAIFHSLVLVVIYLAYSDAGIYWFNLSPSWIRLFKLFFLNPSAPPQILKSQSLIPFPRVGRSRSSFIANAVGSASRNGGAASPMMMGSGGNTNGKNPNNNWMMVGLEKSLNYNPQFQSSKYMFILIEKSWCFSTTHKKRITQTSNDTWSRSRGSANARTSSRFPGWVGPDITSLDSSPAPTTRKARPASSSSSPCRPKSPRPPLRHLSSCPAAIF